MADATAASEGPAGRPTRSSPVAAWVVGAAVATAVSVLHALLHRGEILHGLADESLLVPLARKAWDPRLYAADAWLALAERVFSRTYSYLLGGVLEIADDPVVATRLLAAPFLVVFLAGSFRVLERSAGRAVAAAGTVALAVLPALLARFVGRDAAGPLAAGAALPRDLVFALLPWLWLARDAALASPPAAPGGLARRAALFLALGLLANLHPLTAIHVAALFGVLDVIDAVRGVRRTSFAALTVAGAAFAAGALPFVLQWLAYPRTPGVPPRELVLWRVGGIGADTLAIWVGRLEIPLLFVAAACVLGRGRAAPATRTLRTAAVAALALAALGPLFNLVVAGIQFDRLTRVALWVAAVLCAAELPGAVLARDRAGIALAAVLASLAVGGHVAVAAATNADRGPIEWVARRVEQHLGVVDAVQPDLVPDRVRPGDPSLDGDRAAAFLDVCAWFRELTGRVRPPAEWTHPLVAVPPEEFGAFRAYSRCGAVVTRKEGGFALSFLGGRGNDWFGEYAATVGAWAATTPAARQVLASARSLGWAVLDADQEAPADWREVHRAGPYRVFEIPRR